MTTFFSWYFVCDLVADGSTVTTMTGRSAARPRSPLEEETCSIDGVDVSCDFDQLGWGDWRVTVGDGEPVRLRPEGWAANMECRDAQSRLIAAFPVGRSFEVDPAALASDQASTLLYIIASETVRRVRRLGLLLQSI